MESHPASEVRELESARRVLVVDDNRDAAKHLGMLLALGGHDTRTAHSALEALAVAKMFRPHVALIDIHLSGMSGYDLVSLLRVQHELEGCRYIAVTGYSGAIAIARSVAARFEAHFTKPVCADDLLAAISGKLPIEQHLGIRTVRGGNP
jgi:CheY-like chemotaxis protein